MSILCEERLSDSPISLSSTIHLIRHMRRTRNSQARAWQNEEKERK
jgi:hypothetical protein